MFRSPVIAWRLSVAVLIALSHTLAKAADDSLSPHEAAPAFIASTAQPFSALMDDAMARMHTDMTRAPRRNDADADFVAMMIPHHQGAVDMAKALLLYTKDPALRNLALQIVTEQQNEIKLMEAWRQARQRPQTKTPPPK